MTVNGLPIGVFKRGVRQNGTRQNNNRFLVDPIARRRTPIAAVAIGFFATHALIPAMKWGGAKRKSCEGSAHFTEEMLIQTVGLETL